MQYIYIYLYTRWFKVTFSSPSWRSLNPLKGSLNHPKKVTLNHQVYNIMIITPSPKKSLDTDFNDFFDQGSQLHGTGACRPCAWRGNSVFSRDIHVPNPTDQLVPCECSPQWFNDTSYQKLWYRKFSEKIFRMFYIFLPGKHSVP